MNEGKKVSIIIPSYNCAKWIGDAIDCCLNQNHRNCEIIVVDDGSRDNTAEVVAARYGSMVTYIYQENQGVAKARNTGLRQASGSYIQFLDADDIIHSEKIITQLRIMREMASPAVTYTDYYHCDVNDINRVFPERHVSPEIRSDDPIACLATEWETRLSIPIHCFLFDAAFFRDHGLRFDESLPNNEDWNCWMQILSLRPEFRFIPEKLAAYRIRPNSTCHNMEKMRDGFLMAIAKQQRAFANDPKMTELLKRKEREVRIYYHKYNSLNRLISRLPGPLQRAAQRIIPWRVKRMFD